MKYEFIKIDEDTTKLKYKEKEFDFKRTVGLLEKLQKVNFNAKIKMMKSLKEQGMTSNDLIVVTTEGGKTKEDKSNLVELEQYFIGLESASIYDEICKEFTKMSFTTLLIDIGIDPENSEEIKDFTIKLSMAIMNKEDTPREEVL